MSKNGEALALCNIELPDYVVDDGKQIFPIE